MTSQPLVYIDVSTIRAGKLDVLKTEMERLAAFVEANVPRVLTYGFHLDPEHTQMTVVGVHPDSESLAHHMDVGRSEFRKFSDLIELRRIDVYGPISDPVLERLHAKAAMLGSGSVRVHERYAGFTR